MSACACGCGRRVTPDSRGRPRRFINGHNARGPQRAKWAPNVGMRANRKRARVVCASRQCAVERIGFCLGPIAIHHIDKDERNNEPLNLIPLCASHHHLVDSGRIDLRAPAMPRFSLRPDGARRYAHQAARDRESYYSRREVARG